MKNKGFTLVELLVTIVIIGIVTGISIPLIRNVQSVMTNKKYNTYFDSMKNSAKLYNDSYSEDLFGNYNVGVACISYENLENKKLIKEIGIEGVSCKRNNTFVRVTKINDKYIYAPFLECAKGEDITKKLPEGKEQEINDSFCKLKRNTTIIVELGKDDRTDRKYSRKKREATIKIISATGINNLSIPGRKAIDLRYRWVKYEPESEELEWQALTFKVGNQKEQEKELDKGNLIEAISEGTIRTPTKGDGKYRLEIEVNRLMDWNQLSWQPNNQEDGNKIIYTDYLIDNIPPAIKITNIESTNSKYNDKNVKIHFEGKDNHSSDKELKICVTTGTNECTMDKEFSRPKDATLTGELDGKKRTVTVYIKDLAGNKTKTSYDYQFAIKHTLKYDSDGGSACTNKSITHNVNDGTKWGTLCTPTKKGYKFDGWYSGNTKITKDTVVNSDLNVKAKWNRNAVYITYNMNGGSLSNSHGSEISYSGSTIIKFYDGKWQTLYTTIDYGKQLEYDSSKGKWGLGDYNNSSYINIVKTGYSVPSGAEWINTANNKTYNQNAAYNGTDFCDASKDNCYVDLKVNWKINSYTLRYDDNGGSGCSSKSITKNYNTAWGTLCTPSRKKYKFAGWKNGSTTINSSSTATSNITVKAQWNKYTWYQANPGSSLATQKWEWWNGDGTKIQSGWKKLYANGYSGDQYWYYFKEGYAHDGWLSDGGYWYYLTHEDLNKDGTKDCRMLANECRWVKPENGCWCFDKDGHSTGRHDGMCGYY